MSAIVLMLARRPGVGDVEVVDYTIVIVNSVIALCVFVCVLLLIYWNDKKSSKWDGRDRRKR
jgi:hypothetical protein